MVSLEIRREWGETTITGELSGSAFPYIKTSWGVGATMERRIKGEEEELKKEEEKETSGERRGKLKRERWEEGRETGI